MRRTGETTKTIDKAIQVLFNTGAIKIPYTLNVEENCTWELEQIIVDPATRMIDGSILNIQRHLLDKIIQRLYLEHGKNSFIILENIIRVKK